MKTLRVRKYQMGQVWYKYDKMVERRDPQIEVV